MTAAADFKADYSPGGLSEGAARRARARHAGRRSGIVRRRWARVRRGYLPGQLDAQLEWKIRHVDRDEFDRRYEEFISARPERPSAVVQWERKREAVWEHCASSERLVRARGQHIGTTRGRRARALELRGHARCDRTIYTYNKALEAMGIAGFQHVKAPRGRKDYLRVEWRMSRRLPISPCRQPGGTGNTTSFAGVPRRSTASIPPTASADDTPPDKPAERPATDRDEIERRLAFHEMKLAAGWAIDPLEAAGLRRQLSLLDSEPGQDLDRIASTTSEGLRCST